MVAPTSADWPVFASTSSPVVDDVEEIDEQGGRVVTGAEAGAEAGAGAVAGVVAGQG